jgi:PAB-dependent poly(A)-specific ribonuclease subunit 2
MGFLFDMLDKANGQNCQATNLLKTFSRFREASNLGLLEENITNKPLSSAIQAVNRFFLNQISTDFRTVAPESDELDLSLATVASESIRCMFCRNEIVRPGNSYVNDLIYPVLDLKQARRNPAFKFSNILKTSIERETHNRGWCNHCRRYQQVAIRKTVHRLAPVLMLNTAINNTLYRQLWETPGWLPEEVGVVVDGGQMHCFEREELRLHLTNGNSKIIVYELVGVVAEVDINEHQKPHLVSLIDVSISSQQPESESQWHLFNDFLVTEVSREEALKFNEAWKMPSVLAYQVKSARHNVDDSWKEALDATLLFHEWSLK